jgi:hypothetical protein
VHCTTKLSISHKTILGQLLGLADSSQRLEQVGNLAEAIGGETAGKNSSHNPAAIPTTLNLPFKSPPLKR